MSSIHELFNDLKIPLTNVHMAKELLARPLNKTGHAETIDDLNGLIDYTGAIMFDPDHDEHMDWLDDEHICGVLVQCRAEGEVHFLDAESGEKADLWGYRFYPKGYTKLVGVTVYTQAPVIPKPFKNQKLVFTGELADYTRAQIGEAVRKAGGEIYTNITRTINFLVVGSKPGATKIREANKFKIPMMFEDEFLAKLKV